MIANYNQPPVGTLAARHRRVSVFRTAFDSGNIDPSVVQSFGEEWTKFHAFDDEDIAALGERYFDIVDERMVNKGSYGIDIGCGTGRFTKYLIDRIGFMELIDPSDAIVAADALLGEQANVRLAKASTDNIPFDDETFDFAMSIGVLHHIPDTAKAMADCVRKVKIGGYFFTYLYYRLENRGFVFRSIFALVNAVRRVTSALPAKVKRGVCDVIAVVGYVPCVAACRLLRAVGLENLAAKLPLYFYIDSPWFVLRTDALDRFGTSLEQRFSKDQVIAMMTAAGLDHIVVSERMPYWHAVGQRVR
jgi:SAM-dependent methyltransferase